MRPCSIVLAAALALALAGCGGAPASAPRLPASPSVVAEPPIANFREVRPGLYRGGRPDGDGLEYLKRLGVRRIVNLEIGDFVEAFPGTISAEVRGAEARGLRELRYPMSAFELAKSERFDKNMDALLALLATATAGDPIYVHCKHGQDRTGLVIGLERVLVEHWTPRAAYDEMLNLGFHRAFEGLDRYYGKKTGFVHY